MLSWHMEARPTQASVGFCFFRIVTHNEESSTWIHEVVYSLSPYANRVAGLLKVAHLLLCPLSRPHKNMNTWVERQPDLFSSSEWVCILSSRIIVGGYSRPVFNTPLEVSWPVKSTRLWNKWLTFFYGKRRNEFYYEKLSKWVFI